jgi:Protein of unknown function (DUF1279)
MATIIRLSFSRNLFPSLHSRIRNDFLRSRKATSVFKYDMCYVGSVFEERDFEQSNITRRWYTPLTTEEEENEKNRVAGLSAFQKDHELRTLNREISRLEKLKGINTGEAYTWSGKYKALAREYGMPMVVWYYSVWFSTCLLAYGTITIFNIDVVNLLSQMDARTGWDLVNKVDPQYGRIGMAIVINELIEPIRTPIVILTIKPVVDKLFPPKY